ncbi:hypothetical protein [uncultured Methanosphaera sp.]|uniref:hypothetical protein n=1 Tax=uncultured Methanosphaera sp. TaxID=262501 RepID=UPI000DC23DA9|nr:hypothetical protein [uncultured Methanosphaera sp.]RAP44040.1 MAG: hypothetical protein BZ134_04690 [Methanosphaera sp. SHI1033]
MNIKNIAIIITAIIVIACVIIVTAYMVTDTFHETRNITMNRITLNVPNNDAEVINQSTDYWTYNDTKNNLTIIVIDTKNNDFNKIKESIDFKKVLNQYSHNTTTLKNNNNNITYNKTINQEYTYFGNYTDEKIFIETTNETLLMNTLENMRLPANTTIETPKAETRQSERTSDPLTSSYSPETNTINGEQITDSYWVGGDPSSDWLWIYTEDDEYVKTGGKIYKRYLDDGVYRYRSSDGDIV